MSRKSPRKKVSNAGFYVVLISALSLALTISISLTIVWNVMGLGQCLIHGTSMDPTLEDNSKVLTSSNREIERFDVITFMADTNDVYVKRVIGIPGDTITVKNGKLFVNGIAYDEPYLSNGNTTKYNTSSFTVEVADDSYFVMGDNRDNSSDSRMFGVITSDVILGVVIMHLD